MTGWKEAHDWAVEATESDPEDAISGTDDGAFSAEEDSGKTGTMPTQLAVAYSESASSGWGNRNSDEGWWCDTGATRTREHLFRELPVLESAAGRSVGRGSGRRRANTSDGGTRHDSLRTRDAVRPYWTVWGRRMWGGRHQAAEWIGEAQVDPPGRTAGCRNRRWCGFCWWCKGAAPYRLATGPPLTVSCGGQGKWL